MPFQVNSLQPGTAVAQLEQVHRALCTAGSALHEKVSLAVIRGRPIDARSIAVYFGTAGSVGIDRDAVAPRRPSGDGEVSGEGINGAELRYSPERIVQDRDRSRSAMPVLSDLVAVRDKNVAVAVGAETAGAQVL